MKKIEDFEVMESFGMSNVTIDDMFDIFLVMKIRFTFFLQI